MQPDLLHVRANLVGHMLIMLQEVDQAGGVVAVKIVQTLAMMAIGLGIAPIDAWAVQARQADDTTVHLILAAWQSRAPPPPSQPPRFEVLDERQVIRQMLVIGSRLLDRNPGGPDRR